MFDDPRMPARSLAPDAWRLALAHLGRLSDLTTLSAGDPDARVAVLVAPAAGEHPPRAEGNAAPWSVLVLARPEGLVIHAYGPELRTGAVVWGPRQLALRFTGERSLLVSYPSSGPGTDAWTRDLHDAATTAITVAAAAVHEARRASTART